MSEAVEEKLSANVLIARYVMVRDKIKEVDDAHKEKMRPAKELLESLNNQLLALLNDTGGESIKTAAGTAYRTEKKSATIEDAQAFQDHVVGNGMFEMLDWKANVKAVEDYLREYDELPPGVKLNSAMLVGVRRA